MSLPSRLIQPMSLTKDVLSTLKQKIRPDHRFFEVGALTLTAPRLLGMSKAGQLSWTAEIDGRPVKIYECQSEAHARFIEQVTDIPELQEHMPRCFLRKGTHIIVEWVLGEPLSWRTARQNNDMLQRLAKLQATVHSIQVQGASPGFDYKRYLTERLDRYSGILPMEGAGMAPWAALDHDHLASKDRLSHPDFAARNIVVEKGTGFLKLVDNELMTQNNYYLIDLFNTYWSFKQGLRSEFFEQYLTHYVERGGDLRPLVNDEQFFSLLWRVRTIGTLLQAGKPRTFHEARKLARFDLDAVSRARHPIVRFAKEMRP